MTKNIVLSKADYALISRFVNSNSSSDNYTVKKLAVELKTAVVVDTAEMSEDVVRLNSEVKLKIVSENRILKVKLVIPTQADIKKNFISVFSPLGAALIGYEKGDTVQWEVPAGLKTFEILEVSNEPDPRYQKN